MSSNLGLSECLNEACGHDALEDALPSRLGFGRPCETGPCQPLAASDRFSYLFHPVRQAHLYQNHFESQGMLRLTEYRRLLQLSLADCAGLDCIESFEIFISHSWDSLDPLLFNYRGSCQGDSSRSNWDSSAVRKFRSI